MARTRSTSFLTGPAAMLIAALLALYFAQDIVVPLAFALTLTFLLTPAVTWLERHRFGRIPSVFTVTLLAAATVASLAWIVSNQILDVVNELPKYQDNIHRKIVTVHVPTNGPLGKAAESIQAIGKDLSEPPAPPPSTPGQRTLGPRPQPSAADPLPVRVIPQPENSFLYLRDLMVPALKPLGEIGIVLVFTVFMLLKREDLRNRLLRLAGLAQLNVVTQALDDGARRISRYLSMQVLVNAIYGTLFGAGLAAIGVPNAVLWGVLVAIFRIVPYAGVFAAAACPILLAMAVFNTWLPLLLVIGLFATLEIVTGNFIEPWLYGAHIGVSSLGLLVTTIFWTALWGWAGLILSTPLSVCIILIGRYVPQLSFLHILLGDEVVLSPDAQFYQRLLAMDQIEARTVADRFLKTHSLVEMYDQVLVPALGLAEQDRHKGALEEAREAFFFLSTNELIAELSDYRPADYRPADSKPELAVDSAVPQTQRLICIPANDQADELTAVMLSQILEQAGYFSLIFPVNSSWDDSLHRLGSEDDIVCIAALPPFAFAHARSACARVRELLPEARIVVGIWGLQGDVSKAVERFGHSRPDKVVCSLAQAVGVMREWQSETASKTVPIVFEEAPPV